MEDHRCTTVKSFMLEKGQSFRLGDSRHELAQLPDASADLVFLDGDHTLAYVKAEFLESLRIVRNNGFICIHDYHARGVRLWVDYVRRRRGFEAMVFNTSENRGLAVVVPRRGRASAGAWFRLWFAISRNAFALGVRDRYRGLRHRLTS
jgi:hypothetical protein